MLPKHVFFVSRRLHLFVPSFFANISRTFITPRARQNLVPFSPVASVYIRKVSTTQMARKAADYGTWKSPITSDLVAKGGVPLSGDISVDSNGRVYWSEVRTAEAGKYVICSRKSGDDRKTEWTPDGFSARTRANEYGGGAFFVSNDGVVYFSNFKDQRLYRQTKSDSAPEPLTDEKDGKHMFADGQYVAPLSKVIVVREDHTKVATKERDESENTIVSIDPVTKEQSVLVSGADFYISPSVSSDGKKIAWVEWNHPNMPWDSTEIWMAHLNDNGTAILKDTKSKVAGGKDNSVILPKWSPEDELFYIDDKSDWWNLYQHDLKTGENKNVAPKESEIGGPQWVFGIDGYAFGPKGTNEVYGFFDEELGALNSKTLEIRKISTKNLSPAGSAPVSASSTLVSSSAGKIILVAGSPSQADALFELDAQTGEAETMHSTLTVDIDNGYFSVPEKITYPSSNNQISHAYLYLPKNKDYNGTEGTLPPLMVRAHGGPTAAARLNLNLKHQYLTSRGIAVLDVNYRGSTGYGRKYRDALKGTWGIYDVDDVSNGALHLVKLGKVDKNRLSIDGGSAGGYTTLAALTFKKVFQAGVSLYGVSDLEALAIDTHKFESKYLDQLIGTYPAEKQLYLDRSPIHHTNNLSSAIAFFQGGDDKVVPPSQAEEMYNVVKKKGFKTAYVLFPEEQHGFRNAKNIKRCIDGELHFLSKVFGFEVPDLNVEEIQMEIFN